MIDHVATISTNNDKKLGQIIGDAFRSVNETGVVMMEPTQLSKTEIEIVEGVQYDKGLKNSHFVTNKANKSPIISKGLLFLITYSKTD